MTTTQQRRQSPRPAKPKQPKPEEAGGSQAAAFSLNVAALMSRLSEHLAQALPPMLYGAVRQALASVQVTVAAPPCATCVLIRIAWDTAHAGELAACEAEAREALEAMPPDSPARQQVNPLLFLPDRLKPSADPSNPNPDAIPDIRPSITTIGGTPLCIAHIADAAGPAAPGARKPFLVAQGALSPADRAAATAAATGVAQAAAR